MEKENRAEELINRCAAFAKDARTFVRKLPKDVAKIEDPKQLGRSSGSVGANYIEAQEGLSKKDFVHRVKICRKEARESAYWLALVETANDQALDVERTRLRQEAHELKLNFNATVTSSESNS